MAASLDALFALALHHRHAKLIHESMAAFTLCGGESAVFDLRPARHRASLLSANL